MVSPGSWRDHFKIDDKILKAFWEEFSEASPLRASEFTLETASLTTEFVLWCVQERHFTEQAFTDFQSERFNLPAVRPEYYATPIDEVFWSRVKDLHPWSPSFFPLSEWDGHLLIGSVWPTAPVPVKVPHSVVLGTPTGLRELFERFKSEGDRARETKAEAIPEIPAPAPVASPKSEPEKAPIKTPAKPAADDGDPFAALSRELGLLNNAAEEPSTEAAAESEAPEGFVMPEGLSFSKEEISRLGLGEEAKSEEDSTGTGTGTGTGTASHDGAGVNFQSSELEAAEGLSKLKVGSLESNGGPPSELIEGGTLVHNFETGSQEVVARKTQPNFTIPNESPEAPELKLPELKLNDAAELDATNVPPLEVATVANDDESPKKSTDKSADKSADEPVRKPVLAPQPIAFESPQAVSIKPSAKPPLFGPKPPLFAPQAPVAAVIPNPDLDATQPSVVINHPAPTLPFAPIVTPEKPAAAKPTVPNAPSLSIPSSFAPSSTKATESARQPAEATVVVDMGARPPAEATVVVNAADVGDSALPKTAISERMREMAANRAASITNSGTQTGTKGKKLESTPVTSFFSIGGAAKSSSGRVRNEAYAGKAISISRIEPIHLDQCTSIDEAGAQALLQASNIFETAMILLFKDGELLPWKWSDLFLSVNGEKPAPIELKEPSIFKVVFRTAKPYHGYVVTSTTNQKFFNEFYRGMLPKHATVIPIMIDGRMGGMLLAFTNSKIDYRQSLRLMERLSFDLSRVFKMLRGTMSKAG